MDLIKVKIPHFLGNGGPNDYCDLEMKVEKKLNVLIWNEIAIQIRGMRKTLIKSWDELKREIREIFVPSFYTRDHFVKLEKNVTRSKRDIQYIIELHKYISLSTLVHQASKDELQLKRHGKRTYPITSSNWKGKERRDKLLKRDKSPKKGSAPFKGQKD
ncbi:hypothetical protein CR513_38981, partial [Mucuna pruriens]